MTRVVRVVAMGRQARESSLRRVRDELKRWQAMGKTPAFWLRDDDACSVTAQLERLASVVRSYQLSGGLAAIPGLLQGDFVAWVAEQGGKFQPMCHGWKHINHQPSGPPSEFGDRRAYAAAHRDVEHALQAFAVHFPTTPPVFVPPFNRMSPALIPALADIGFCAVSSAPRRLERRLAQLLVHGAWLPAFGIARPEPLPRMDAHIDLLDWGSGSARDDSALAEDLVGQLRLRRKGFLASSAPIGLLTHHRVHDERTWAVLQRLLAFLKREEAVTFLDAGNILTRAPEAARLPATVHR